MSKRSLFSRYFPLAIAALAQLGCAQEATEIDDETTATAIDAITADEAVRVECAALFTMSKYGMTWNNYQFQIRVADIDYNKQVSIWAESPGGTWFDIPANYEHSAGNGQQIWSAYTGSDFSKFAVQYTVLGQTYWDNNSGNDYTLVGQGQNLYHGINVLASNPGIFSSTSLGVWVYIRNLAYNKQVNVVYTTDGWATSNTTAIGYVTRDYYGYGSAASPNDAGIELWSGNLNVGNASRVDWAVSYTANGQTYWDNNNGDNYVVYR